MGNGPQNTKEKKMKMNEQKLAEAKKRFEGRTVEMKAFAGYTAKISEVLFCQLQGVMVRVEGKLLTINELREVAVIK